MLASASVGTSIQTAFGLWGVGFFDFFFSHLPPSHPLFLFLSLSLSAYHHLYTHRPMTKREIESPDRHLNLPPHQIHKVCPEKRGLLVLHVLDPSIWNEEEYPRLAAGFPHQQSFGRRTVLHAVKRLAGSALRYKHDIRTTDRQFHSLQPRQ